jgi:hypothetical protein
VLIDLVLLDFLIVFAVLHESSLAIYRFGQVKNSNELTGA